MAGYLIWIPMQPGIVEKNPAKLLAAAGLSELLRADDACPMVCEAPTPEPGGGERMGQLLFFDDPGRPGPAPALVEDRQTWRKLTPRDGLAADRGWVGWYSDAKPGPEDLARRKMHAGDLADLADGQKWLVPVIRMLPKVYDFDDSGALVSRFTNVAYQALGDRTADLWGRFLDSLKPVGDGKEKAEINHGEFVRFAADVLCLNYRLTVDIALALSLIGTDSLDVLLAAAGAMDEKKSAQATSNGDEG